MSELAQFSRLRLLLVLLLFGCVLCQANTNHRVSTHFILWVSSPSLNFAAPPWPGESVRSELARLQEQTGLSLATVENRGIWVVVFSQRSLVKAKDLHGGLGMVSPDGTEVAFAAGLAMPGRPPRLGVSRTDGGDFREYPNVLAPANNAMCWSYDKSKLVIGSMNTGSLSGSLQLVDVGSGLAREIAKIGRVTSQCWSPDSKHFVYEGDSGVRVYDVEENLSRGLVKGKQATWSPDGSQIAFLDDDTYYAIDTAGTKERRALFKKWHPASGLWWSPDSQFVAYVSQAGPLEGGLSALDVETYWLRVRRLKDNSETRVAGAGGGENCGWVTNAELFRAAKSNVGQPPSLSPEFAGKVFLVGAVVKQGWYPLEGGGTILQALAAAGGLAPYAKADSIYIERNEGKKHLRIPFHYKKAQQGSEKDIPLKPGDVVIVR
jgi:hypothetical protein